MKRENLAKRQIDLIRETICVEQKCRECRDLLRKGDLRFSMLEDFIDDRGRSCLYRLKEMCHELFRNAETVGNREKLYDMTVGYIFHEAMKLRENLYQLEHYMPLYEGPIEGLSQTERKAVGEINLLIVKAERRMREGLREITTLVGRLLAQLRDLLKAYSGNHLLPRFMLENERALVRIYGREGFQGLLREMWNDGRVQLLYRAAESYLGGEFYERARALFAKVMERDRENRRVQFLYHYASAFHFYFRSQYAMALRSARQAGEELPVDGTLEQHRKDLANLIQELERERRGKEKGTPAKENRYAHL